MPLRIDTPVEILPLRYYYPDMPGGYEMISGLVTGVQRRWWGTRYQVVHVAFSLEQNAHVRVYDWYRRKDLIELYDA